MKNPLRAGKTTVASFGDRFWQPLVVLVIITDLLLFMHRLYPSADPALLRYTPEVITRMQKDQDLWRFTTFDPESRKSLPANTGWFHTIQDIRGYDSIFSAYYRRYMETIDTQDELLYNRIAPLRNGASLGSPLLDLLNVKYILTEHPVNNPRYLLIDRREGLLLYRNTGALPRAFTLPLSSTVQAEDPFKAMRSYDPRFYMVLPAEGTTDSDPPYEQSKEPNPGIPRSATVESYRNNEVTLSVSAEEPVWLVLADAYDTGWQATAWPRGYPDRITRLPVRRAYGALRTVMVEKGEWLVRYRYRPAGFMPGLLLSLASGTLFIIGLVALYRKPGNH